MHSTSPRSAYAGTADVAKLPAKPPAAPVTAITANILRWKRFERRCPTAPDIAPAVLTPMFVPAATNAEDSAPRIMG